jgi:hypothetical protein
MDAANILLAAVTSRCRIKRGLEISESIQILPLDALSNAKPKDEPADTAPAAAWLRNPNAIRERKTFAQLLIEDLEQNGEWRGPAYGPPENPADE